MSFKIQKKLVVLSFIFTSISTYAGALDLKGIEAENKGDKEVAVSFYKKACETKDDSGCLHFATMLYNGDGTQQDYKKATDMYKRLCDSGNNALACQNLGNAYLVKQQDGFKALQAYSKACEKNLSAACNEIGNIYKDGNGIEKNPVIAFQYYLKSAELGNNVGEYNTALSYHLGRGISVDYTKAFNWYKKSAEAGYASAQANLGYLYLKGLGCNQDMEASYKWYKLAADQGSIDGLVSTGNNYYMAQGTDMNKMKAFSYWLQASKQGSVQAQNNLDMLCKESPWVCH